MVNGTEPTPLPNTNTSALNNASSSNSSVGASNVTSQFQQAGYSPDVLTPDGQLKAATDQVSVKTLSLSASLDFMDRTLSQSQNYIVVNKQTHKLWHMFMDELLLTEGIQSDLSYLQGKSLEANVDLFNAFFEKYGTHYISACFMGGAIELTSIIQTTAVQQSINVTIDLFALYNVGNILRRIVLIGSSHVERDELRPCQRRGFHQSNQMFVEDLGRGVIKQVIVACGASSFGNQRCVDAPIGAIQNRWISNRRNTIAR